MIIQQRLFELQDETYADFQSKLTPTLPREKFIGVRIPKARELVRDIKGGQEAEAFLHDLPHEFYDENMLHALLISEITDYDQSIRKVNCFLPYVDNWAVCDSLSPKTFKKNRDKLLENIYHWVDSEHTYTCRFGMKILMTHYLDEDFRPEYLEIPAAVWSEEYYVKMMIAWFYSTALVKQWNASISYITDQRLEPWVHNKTIQKARESRRTTVEQKAYLKSLRRKLNK